MLSNVSWRSLSSASVSVLFSAMRMRLSPVETQAVHYRVLCYWTSRVPTSAWRCGV